MRKNFQIPFLIVMTFCCLLLSHCMLKSPKTDMYYALTVVLGTVTGFYTVGGTVKGLNGQSLILMNNEKDTKIVSADGGFLFLNRLKKGETYSVKVFSQPTNPSQICSVSASAGTVTGNVDSVSVSCVSSP